MNNIHFTEGGITSPKGFKAAGVHAGIKREKRDLALIVSENGAAAAGVFTTNKVKAAPVIWDMAIADSGKARAIVVNSGNANACTGEQGAEDNERMAAVTAEAIKADKQAVLVCSTGVIGVAMPMEKIVSGIPEAAKALSNGAAADENAATAIMTTDTFKKETAATVAIGGKNVTIAGIAKGSGMVHPNMATVLCFVTTDCAITPVLLRKALKQAADVTFNMVTVDGDTSTNDTILVLANGAAGNAEISEENADYATFAEALTAVLKKLAKDVAKDGEGATKLIEITVKGANTAEDAKALARSVASSNLVKAAMFGADANCGRIMCAMGYSKADFDPSGASLTLSSKSGSVETVQNGTGKPFDEAKAKAVLSEAEIFIEIALNDGQAEATAWGCDLTYDYVRINGDYRS